MKVLKECVKITFMLIFTHSFYFLNAQCTIESNLVTNGNFTSGNSSFTSSYSYSPGDLHPEGKYDVLNNPQTDHASFSACGDHTSGSGNMLVVNGASTADVSVWCATVAVDASTTYTFSAWLASVHPTSPAILQFSINGVNLGSTFTASSTTCQWEQFCETWNSGVSTSANICIVNQNIATNGNDFALDDIQMGKTSYLYAKLVKFEAQKMKDEILINWASSIEINHDYYVLEKSSDLKNWNEITKIQGSENSNSLKNYQYLDSQNYHT